MHDPSSSLPFAASSTHATNPTHAGNVSDMGDMSDTLGARDVRDADERDATRPFVRTLVHEARHV